MVLPHGRLSKRLRSATVSASRRSLQASPVLDELRRTLPWSFRSCRQRPWWPGFKNFSAGQAEAEQVREAARPRQDHVVGQPQCFRRQILWELPMSCEARISSLTLYVMQRGDFIWQQRDLRPCDSDFETVFRAVDPRAAVRLDGDNIPAELRSVSIVALEEAVGCVFDFQVEPLRHVLQDNTTCLSHGLPIRNLWFVWVQFDPEQYSDSASDVLWRQQSFLHHHVLLTFSTTPDRHRGIADAGARRAIRILCSRLKSAAVEKHWYAATVQQPSPAWIVCMLNARSMEFLLRNQWPAFLVALHGE
jgi:hypothetical protein